MGEKHHYIPVTYIKWFVNSDRKVWTRKLNSPHPDYPKEYFPDQIAYEKGYFRSNNFISNQHLQINNDFVEDVVNAEYENVLNGLVERLTGSIQTIFFPDRLKISELIVHLKRRSPYFRYNLYSRENFLVAGSDIAKNILKSGSNKIIEEGRRRGFDDNQLVDLSHAAVNWIAENDDYRKDLHLHSLVTRGNEDPTLNRVYQNLAMSHWEIFQAEEGSKFISSDNPGFILDEQGNLHNMGFGGHFKFYFPLSSRFCLVLTRGLEVYNFEINVRILSSKSVYFLNKNTAMNCHKYVFGSEKPDLVQIRK